MRTGTASSPVSTRGVFVSWDGGCIFIGHSTGVVPVHAHYAIQVAFGDEPGIGFRADDREAWTEYGGAIIPSRQPHSMDVQRVSANAVLFVEPETREGRAITERHLRDGIAAMPGEVLAGPVRELFRAWREERGRDAIEQACRRVIHALDGGVEPSVVSDERILRAAAYVRRHLDGPITLDDVAAEACLSPSRFRHLFVEQTGMALRPYILWRRFLRAWELIAAGESLSTAAHGAGFADAAHLTRTSRTMFGFPPSVMLMMDARAANTATATNTATDTETRAAHAEG